jgi:hypothetical protein
MSTYKNTKRMNIKSVKKFDAYFALKSKNEIYYQMASIFKEVSNEKKISTQTAFMGLLTYNSSKTLMENQF